jgi:hypothetical protein
VVAPVRARVAPPEPSILPTIAISRGLSLVGRPGREQRLDPFRSSESTSKVPTRTTYLLISKIVQIQRPLLIDLHVGHGTSHVM